MIERQFVGKKIKEFQIQEFIAKNLRRVGHSHTTLTRTPMGERILIHASKPGLIVGRKGQNIKKLTKTLKVKFNLDNPQIEIAEVEEVNLNPSIIAERIANSLERFGSSRFKGVGHKAMADVMMSGALGVEILISGKIPSSRSKRWRFYQGYLKKCGDIALVGVRKAYSTAKLKTGIVGIQVRIMPPDLILPDNVEILESPVEEVSEEASRDECDAAEGIDGKTKSKSEDKRSEGNTKEKTKEKKEGVVVKGASKSDSKSKESDIVEKQTKGKSTKKEKTDVEKKTEVVPTDEPNSDSKQKQESEDQ